MIIEDLYNELKGLLCIRAVITKIEGELISVGEKFKITFSVTNMSNSDVQPIVFLNPKLKMWGTEYARPTGTVPSDNTYDFPDTRLEPGMRTSKEIEFKALKDYSWWDDLFKEEPVAYYYVLAEFDTKEFFTIKSATRLKRKEIH